MRTQCRQALAATPPRLLLRPVYLGDDLFACRPIVVAIQDVGGNFILTCNPASHKTIANTCMATGLQEHRQAVYDLLRVHWDNHTID